MRLLFLKIYMQLKCHYTLKEYKKSHFCEGYTSGSLGEFSLEHKQTIHWAQTSYCTNIVYIRERQSALEFLPAAKEVAGR